MSTYLDFWLSDATTNILLLGDNVNVISLGGSNRNFNVQEYAYSNGGYIKGFGNYSPKKFSFTRDDYISTASEVHSWNVQRNDFMRWFTRSQSTYITLNMRYSTDGITLNTTVYPISLPADDFKNYFSVNFARKFELISPSGIWEASTAQTSTNITLASTATTYIILNNQGVIDCAPIFTWTPSALGNYFQVRTAENYGFRLEGSFSSGVNVVYDMKTGRLTIGGNDIDVSNYLTAGSPFLFPAKSTYLYIRASVGTFSYSYNMRFV